MENLELNDEFILEDVEDTSTEDTSQDNTTEISTDESVDLSESVGSVEDNQDNQEDILESGTEDSSPKDNFYSSIAAALKDENVLPELDETTINTPEEFKEAIDKAIASRVGEKVERVNKALEYNVDVSEIKAFEDTLSNLDSITESHIKDETDEGEALRKQLIYQDYINKGFKEDRALRATEKSFKAGTDIEDAIDALNENKDFFKLQYNSVVEEAKIREDSFKKQRDEIAENLKTSILSTEEFEGVTLDKATRQKVYDNITKPSHRDENGNYYTALQKYEMENSETFIKTVGYLFTLTDGFKNMNVFVNPKVKKEVKRNLRELEHTLNNTNRTTTGELKYVSNVIEDNQSYDNLSLDI